MYHSYLNSLIGLLEITANDSLITSICLVEKEQMNTTPSPLTEKAKEQLQQYFSKDREVFDLPLDLNHQGFQYDVLKALAKIPYGETVSYGLLARLSNHPNGERAVGNAIHKNPFLIVIPCHRVVKSDGSLGGFALGPEIKAMLLKLEKKV